MTQQTLPLKPSQHPLEEGSAALSPIQKLARELLRAEVKWPRAQREIERIFIIEALALCAGNRSRTAALLGISRQTLLQRIADHGLDKLERLGPFMKRNGAGRK